MHRDEIGPSPGGLWTRTVTARDIAKAGPLDGPAPAGRWELAFDRIGAWELDPLKEGLADEIAVRGDRLAIYVPINSVWTRVSPQVPSSFSP